MSASVFDIFDKPIQMCEPKGSNYNIDNCIPLFKLKENDIIFVLTKSKNIKQGKVVRETYQHRGMWLIKIEVNHAEYIFKLGAYDSFNSRQITISSSCNKSNLKYLSSSKETLISFMLSKFETEIQEHQRRIDFEQSCIDTVNDEKNNFLKNVL